MQGVHGTVLHVALPGPRAHAEALPEAVYRRYVGGVGLGLWLLQRATGEAYAAEAPEAPLVFSFAPLVGSALNTTAKCSILSKSPLTGRLNDAMISSHFALAGKATGHDALVLTGRCEAWSTLFIDADGCRVEAAPHLCGLSAEETGARIRAGHGTDWQVVAIGPAGEAGVPFATLSHAGRHAGRGGTGAVLGSKRLKAVAVRGARPTTVAEPEAVATLREQLKRRSLGPGTEKYRTTGTLGNLLVFNRMGILPTRNFGAGSDAAAEGLSAERLYATGRVQRATCADCMIGCEKRYVDADQRSTRLEYESVFALGALPGVWDMDAVLEASRLCDHYGLDTISTGATLGFAADCVQRGLLDEPALRQVDGAVLVEAVHKTARREGYGALLALGSRALAARLGPDARSLAPHVKGLELPGYHPARLQTLALGLAVGARGADHNKSGAYELDLSGHVRRDGLDTGRIEAMVALEDQAAVMDSLILCKFMRRALDDLYAEGAEMLRLVTGAPFSAENLAGVARRVHDLRKRFNQAQGWTLAEDTLPTRFFGLPGDTGALDAVSFQEARAAYYARRGWDDAGRLPGEREAEAERDADPA